MSATRKPYRCRDCRAGMIAWTIIPTYVRDRTIGGKLYEIRLADLGAMKCNNCGKMTINDEADDRICATLRELGAPT